MKGTVVGESALVMSEADTVATALADLEEGFELQFEDKSITLQENVDFGHKIAITGIEAGEHVYKYGEVIGAATREIDPGEWVHIHNCESTRGRGDINASETEHAAIEGNHR